MSQCKVNVKCRDEWIAVTEYTRIHCRLPIKVRKTMFLISGLNIFFSFYPLVVFTSTIALSPVFVLIVCWITLRGKLRRQFTITNLHYFGDKRKSFTVFSLLFFQCAGGAFVEECVAFVFKHMRLLFCLAYLITYHAYRTKSVTWNGCFLIPFPYSWVIVLSEMNIIK